MPGSPKIRMPVVAGTFYEGPAQRLKAQLERLIDKKTPRSDVIACMLPHAGYMYSGRVAGETVSHTNIKDKIILLGPNHTGNGAEFSIMTEGVWRTPLGDVKIDSLLAAKILACAKPLTQDSAAHRDEHSLEVELPLLQYLKPDFEIVPIAFMSADVDALKETGRGIAQAIKDSGMEKSTLIVASSDMTHYEPQAEAEAKDRQAINAILELDENKLAQKISALNITMCGYAPVIAALAAAKSLGAKSAKLIKYETSGDITGDKSSVVGYAGIQIY